MAAKADKGCVPVRPVPEAVEVVVEGVFGTQPVQRLPLQLQ